MAVGVWLSAAVLSFIVFDSVAFFSFAAAWAFEEFPFEEFSVCSFADAVWRKKVLESGDFECLFA
jgi:hypothetical protein